MKIMTWLKKPTKESKLSRLDKIKLAALFISLGAHTVFLITSSIFRVPPIVVPPSVPERQFHVKIAREEKLVKEPPPPVEADAHQSAFRFESPTSTRNIRSFLEKEREASKDRQSMVLHEKLDELAPVREEPKVIALKDVHRSDAMRQTVERKTASSLTSTIALNADDLMDEAGEVVNMENMYSDFVDKMPGFTPSLVKNTFEVTKRAQADLKQKQMPVISKMKEVDNLERALVWTLGVYTDPRDQQKYFKISIRVGEDNKILKTNRKELLFLVDYSKSVQEERVQEFKDGIGKSLSLLNEGDLYNVIIFKEIIFEFQENKSVPATPENIAATEKFLDRHQTAEKTDAFEVLSKAIERKSELTPSYIILLSDGRPTQGVTNSREVINRISQINDGKKAIFTLSGGLRVNRYLLDFVAYKNRGWSEFSDRTNRISDQIITLNQKIDDPIIMNLRYYLSGLKEEETFPTILPDFFRNAEFTLYGTYEREKEFAMQLLGDVEGKTREYILRSDFSEAYQGDESIARNWAFNKLFHLISLLRHDRDNKELIAQIEEISKKFDLQNPYLEEMIR